jgi:putative colanic acid biosynthesis acetyltransferase WcaF
VRFAVLGAWSKTQVDNTGSRCFALGAGIVTRGGRVLGKNEDLSEGYSGASKEAGDFVPSALCPSPVALDVSKEKCPSPHSLGNKLARVAWAIVWGTLFRWSPRILFGWRRFLLRCFGATIGKNARISPSVKVWAPWNLSVGDESSIAHCVDCYCVDRLRIGSHATISQYSFLCTASHDIRDPHMHLIHGPIEVADQAWVCAGVFVGMGRKIHEGAVVGAMSVVVQDVEPWTIVAGNPARSIGLRQLNSVESR